VIIGFDVDPASFDPTYTRRMESRGIELLALAIKNACAIIFSGHPTQQHPSFTRQAVSKVTEHVRAGDDYLSNGTCIHDVSKANMFQKLVDCSAHPDLVVRTTARSILAICSPQPLLADCTRNTDPPQS
jgi:hypothetical protein